MSRTTKKVTKTVEVEESKTCDWCGVTHQADTRDSPFNEPDNGWSAFTFRFEIRRGTAYPDGGSGTEVSPDLCYECVGKLEKLMKDAGIKLAEREWDF